MLQRPLLTHLGTNCIYSLVFIFKSTLYNELSYAEHLPSKDTMLHFRRQKVMTVFSGK